MALLDLDSGPSSGWVKKTGSLVGVGLSTGGCLTLGAAVVVGAAVVLGAAAVLGIVSDSVVALLDVATGSYSSSLK